MGWSKQDRREARKSQGTPLKAVAAITSLVDGWSSSSLADLALPRRSKVRSIGRI